MKFENYFYNCSKPYIESISPTLYEELLEIISKLPKRKTQSEINVDLFWTLTDKGWAYDSVPAGLSEYAPRDLDITANTLSERRINNKRALCATSTTLDAKWHADFAKSYNNNLVQIEAQFGTVESMFKDFCGFRIAAFERRLSLGIEIILSNPNSYFTHRKSSIAGMAYFNIAKNTLLAIGLNCPIWLIGMRE